VIARRFHGFLDVISAYKNNDLFTQGTLCSHIDIQFGFISVVDYLFDIFDLLV